MMKDMICHYDLLVEENNDPVRDPAELQAYMDQWDGALFMKALELDGPQSVLEIGVGTGRLAMRTAPCCRCFTGIDLSPKTIARAGENLAHLSNVKLMCGDFLTAEFEHPFDVIYSSLTFMHISRKQEAINKIVALLSSGGRVVLSLDKGQENWINYGTRKIRVYPDDPQTMTSWMEQAGLDNLSTTETSFAHIIKAGRR